VPDGVPESLVLGLTIVVEGSVSAAFLVAGGAILTMLADTMTPEAFEHGGKLIGIETTFGFALAFAISSLS
jgi:zinc transporter, ZIP family